jgi:hypothetical protein
MRYLMVLTLLLGLGLFAPQASAQTTLPEAAGPTASLTDLTKGQLLAIGAGAVAGAVVLHAVLPGDLAFMIGGVAGGLLADYWYNNGGAETLRASINHMPAPTHNATAGQIMQVRLTR